MTDLPSLTGPMLGPASGAAPKQVVLLLHGLGADGQDLIGLAPAFADVLPDAVFIAPDAHQPCDMAPYGRQWFSLQDFGADARARGAAEAAPVLDAFIDGVLAQFGLDERALVLSGFSQGAMMSLYVGLRRAKPVAGILGYSGMLVSPDTLAADIVSRPRVRLVHGDADPIVPFAALGEAEAALAGAGVAVDTFARPGLAHGIDEEGIALGRAFLKEVF